jgi:dolichyl-phosphate-mannose--protein O-mannosyl transferase
MIAIPVTDRLHYVSYQRLLLLDCHLLIFYVFYIYSYQTINNNKEERARSFIILKCGLLKCQPYDNFTQQDNNDSR